MDALPIDDSEHWLTNAYAEGRKDEREAMIDLLTWAYSKLHYRSFDNMEDALQLDRMKLLFTENLL